VWENEIILVPNLQYSLEAMDSGITQVMARLRTQSHELWPETPPQDFRIVRHLPRPYSNVYRLQLVSPLAATSFVYVKILAPKAKSSPNPEKYIARLAAEFDAGQRLYAAFRHEKEFAVIKPVAYYPEFLAIVSEEAPGESLAHLIAREGRLWPAAEKMEGLAKHCRRAGQALAAMQTATPETAKFNPAELIEYIDVRLQRLLASEQTPFSSADRRQILKFLESAIPAIPSEQLTACGTHGDYAPFNLLAAPEKITVADLTMFKTGSAYNDLTYFYHRLEGYLHKPIYRRQTIRHLQNAFLGGYVEAMGKKKQHWRVDGDLLFKILWIKHVVNNYSALMRQRVAPTGKAAPFSSQLFNRHVFRRYNLWLKQFCQSREGKTQTT
jgi:aminoglycoside phosphotransferase (APT) family kinase protein